LLRILKILFYAILIYYQFKIFFFQLYKYKKLAFLKAFYIFINLSIKHRNSFVGLSLFRDLH